MTNQTKYLFVDVMGHLLFKYPLNLQTETTHRVLSYSRANFFFNVGMQLPSLVAMRIWALQSLWSVISRKRYLRTLQKIILTRLAQGQHVKQELLYMSAKSTIPRDDDEWGATRRRLHSALYSSTCPATHGVIGDYARRSALHSPLMAISEAAHGSRVAPTCGRASTKASACRRRFRARSGEKRSLAPRRRRSPLVVDGHVIPRGVHVGVNTYSLLHNDEYFPEPFVFKPERWLDAASGQANKDAFAPFSLGARGCLGKSVAYMGTSLVIAKTLWHFDFEECSVGGGVQQGRSGDEFRIRDMFSAVHDGPYLTFREVGRGEE
ncbi:hypothetical protein J3459_008674 [Metarhizium acridum]|nr:hypothetical protein J3459_008674 [Metarhizium acridum]